MQLPAPTGVSARFYGPYNAANATTWYYWVQALYPEGYSELSAAGVTSAHAPAALGPYGFNAVQWNPAPGAIGYLVWRGTTSTPPGIGGTQIFIATSETGIKDDGTLTTQTGTVRYDGMYVWKAIYNFATDGGGVGAIIPAISDTIPKGAIVLGGAINAITAIAPATGATIAVGTSAGSAANSIQVAVIALGGTDGVQEVLGTNSQFGFGPATTPTTLSVHQACFKMSAAGQIQITIAVDPVTAGVLEIDVFGIVASSA